MKQFFYIFLLMTGIVSVTSCSDLVDEQGNPLLDLNQNNGFNGPRALFREVTDSDTIAEYRYNGLLLTQVLTDSASVTDISWSNDRISKITFNGFLDEDRSGWVDKDSITYTQLMTYGNGGNVQTISENRAIYRRPPPVAPSTTPGPKALFKRTRTIYTVKYSATTGKMSGISMITGDEITGTPFAFKNYSETTYAYLGDNVSEVLRNYGALNGAVPGTATEKYSYAYTVYDTQISPFTLLPMVYKISRILSTRRNDFESQIFSPNSPRRLAVTDLTQTIPTPVLFTTNYNYDAQTYMSKGFGVNYIYKPL